MSIRNDPRSIIREIEEVGKSGTISMGKLNRLKTQFDNAILIYSGMNKHQLSREGRQMYQISKRRIEENIKQVLTPATTTLGTSIVQQTGGQGLVAVEAASPLVARQYEVVREINLANHVPPNSRMMVKTRTFKVGEILEGTDKCTGADAGYIEVQDGMTYRFPCGRNSALRPRSLDDIVQEDDGGRTVTTDEAVEQPNFFQKNKTALILVGVLAAAGIGYFIWKKNK